MKKSIICITMLSIMMACTKQLTVNNGTASRADILAIAHKYGFNEVTVSEKPNGLSSNINTKEEVEKFFRELRDNNQKTELLSEESDALVAAMDKIGDRSATTFYTVLEHYPNYKQHFIESVGGKEKFEEEKKQAIETQKIIEKNGLKPAIFPKK